jgi:hypothetical protein
MPPPVEPGVAEVVVLPDPALPSPALLQAVRASAAVSAQAREVKWFRFMVAPRNVESLHKLLAECGAQRNASRVCAAVRHPPCLRSCANVRFGNELSRRPATRLPSGTELPRHRAGLRLAGLEDQQLGGLVMWVPASLVYVICGLAIAARWLAGASTPRGSESKA